MQNPMTQLSLPLHNIVCERDFSCIFDSDSCATDVIARVVDTMSLLEKC